MDGDTLGYPGSYQTLMDDIWGSSAKDVYAVGHNSQNRGLMWHYDGKKWIDVHLITSEGGQISGAIDLSAIYGFSSTNIYAVGERIRPNPSPPPNFIDSSLIIHYDGSTWKEVNVYNGRHLNDIYGNSLSEIWAGGGGEKMYHYNGSKWEADSISISVRPDYIFQVTAISSYNSNIYLIGNSNNNSTAETITYFIKRANNKWVLQDSAITSGNGSQIGLPFGERLNQSRLSNLFSNGMGGIYKYDGSSWGNFFQQTYPIISMWGTSNENIFAVGNIGRVYHYNGTDWKQIAELNNPQTDYFAVWTDGTEAFVVGHINDGAYQKTIIWHGK